jgi:sulfoxide reductase heme-binding subunit YedZ
MLQFSRSTINRGIKPVVFVLSLLPLALLVHAAATDNLGANPVERLTHQTGLWGLYFLLLTLSITPLKQFTGVAWPVSLRRMLGLYAFFYACLHLAVYFWLDQSFLWEAIVEDILKRPYITLGLTAWLLLLPLALTSNQLSMRLLKKNWKRLHRLVYIAALLVVFHFVWLVKADYSEPKLYLGILLFLLLARTRIFKWRG